jgi:hypothetical protein
MRDWRLRGLRFRRLPTAVTLGTLTVPNDGCTVRFSSGIDNELNSNGSGGYVLRRPHDGASGTLTATLWQDCWVAADGTQYENVLGDVLANEVPIVVARTMKEVEMCRWRYPWWDYGAGNLQTRLRFAGRVLAVVFEPWTSPFANQIQTRLRFTPMPAAQTVIDANLQVAAQVVSASDILNTETPVPFWTPANLDESILAAIALQKWTISPFFRTDSARKGIDLQYLRAVDGAYTGRPSRRPEPPRARRHEEDGRYGDEDDSCAASCAEGQGRAGPRHARSATRPSIRVSAKRPAAAKPRGDRRAIRSAPA